jgi:hypothetical protein
MLTNLGKVGHAPSALFAERRLTGFVSFALGDVGNLSPDFEHDLFDATSGRKIATRRTPRRHRGHGCERDAHKLISASTSDWRTSSPRFWASVSCSISVFAVMCVVSASVRGVRLKPSRKCLMYASRLAVWS